MKFQIDKQKLSDDQLLFLANFEIYFKQYVEKVLASYPDLGVIPCWNIMERKEQFFILESNALKTASKKEEPFSKEYGISLLQICSIINGRRGLAHLKC